MDVVVLEVGVSRGLTRRGLTRRGLTRRCLIRTLVNLVFSLFSVFKFEYEKKSEILKIQDGGR